MNKGFGKGTFKRSVVDNVKSMFRRTIDEATPRQVSQAVAYAVKGVIIDEWIATHREHKKKDVETIYYLFMEFLMGRALGNNIINICAGDEIKEAPNEMGFDLNMIGDQEPDAALGSGGLGRLAACFLDSLTTLGYPAYGCGIRYRCGMFKQEIKNGHQVEVLDNWLKDGNPSEIRRPEYTSEIKLGGYVRIENQDGVNHFVQDGYQSIRAVPYDLPTIGYGNNVVNTLCTWDTEPINTSNLNSFDRGDYQRAMKQESLAKTIVEVLYPNDNHYAGKELRLKQQYFFISANVQRTVKRYGERHDDIREFYEKVAFQLNDTHPTVAIPELMRIPLGEEGPIQGEAWEVAAGTCAYTNHTIMSEALEKWSIELFSWPLLRTYQIVKGVGRGFQNQIQTMYPGNQEKLHRMSIIYDGQVKMAYMAIAASFSVNGVARLHTEILKRQELKDFYEMMPEEFNNKISGITQRRLPLHDNPLLVDWVTSKIGDERITDLPHTRKLELFAGDEKYQFEFMNIKHQNKLRLARHIKENNGIGVGPCSILDVQVKRLRKYKRQSMNILHVVYLHSQLKNNPDMDMIPRTFVSGAEAAASYKRAKLTIKLINSAANIVNNDKSINGKIRVVFIEGYHVSNAELIFAAADISEQASTASKGAPGTSNMKFILNGAPTLGIMNGANMEIVEEVGADNAFIFGMPSDGVISCENNDDYCSVDIFNNDQKTRRVLMRPINGCYAPDNPGLFRDIYNSLLNTKSSDRADTYFTLKDFHSYVEAHRRADRAYRDQAWWAKAAILNTANCGEFTSSHTIEEYVRGIWHLKKVTVEM